jgi:DNA polymerase
MDLEEREKQLKNFWKLISDTYDYLTDGYRIDRPVPRFSPAGAVRTEEGTAAVRKTGADREEPSADRRQAGLETIAGEVSSCTKCGLHRERNLAVPGEGALDSLVMCIGEGPGFEEDRTGKPFVGKAGKYLDKWLDAVGLSRERNCFIGNIVKCHPPQNRDPEPAECSACLPYLERQISIIRPKTILCLGRISARILSGKQESMARLRGSTFEYLGVPCIPTYHPSAVLRNPDLRKPVWEDLKRIKAVFTDG